MKPNDHEAANIALPLPHLNAGLPFIPSKLDEHGLTPVEFRIYCHIVRRGKCWEATKTTAHICKVNTKTARTALRRLVSIGMVKAAYHSGQTTEFEATLPASWQPYPNEYPTQTDTQVSERGGSVPKAVPSHPTQTDTHKGTPIKVLPLRNKNTHLPIVPDTAGQSDVKGGVCSVQNELNETAKKIYDAYPRKVGKPAALQKIRKAIKEHDPAKVLAATKAFADMWQGETSLQFCPHPATWYGQERFNDDPATWKPHTSAAPANRVNRNTGTMNDGHENDYANVGKRQTPANAITTTPPMPTKTGVSDL